MFWCQALQAFVSGPAADPLKRLPGSYGCTLVPKPETLFYRSASSAPPQACSACDARLSRLS